MPSKPFSPSELITKDPRYGFPLFGPSRILGVSIATLERFYRDFTEMVDKKTRNRIAKNLGYEVGLGQATTLSGLYAFSSPSEHLHAGSRLRSFTGYCHEHITSLDITPEGKLVRFTGLWTESFETAVYLKANSRKNKGYAKRPVCLSLCAILSGYASAVFGEKIVVRETACQAMGTTNCHFEGKPATAWAHGEAPPYMDDESDHALESNITKLREILGLEKNRAPAPPFFTPTAPVCKAPNFRAVLDRTDKVAPTDATVLILGESGSGKEVVARRIHAGSRRNRAPFLAINCAALPPELLESELFGHVRGAFTGAEKTKKGLFVSAGEGTIFLDEIGDMPLPVQGKLLRALQEREVRPVGGLEDIPVKARIVAATNRDLAAMAREGSFRQDLYYRLSVFPISLPSLAERKEDILPLAHAALKKRAPDHPGFSATAENALLSHPWPGNVRELENWVEHGLILAGDDLIDAPHLPETHQTTAPADSIDGDLPSLEALTHRYIDKVLTHTGGNKKETAHILGIGTATLWRHLKKTPPAFKG
ncbi:sigma 54-interacting transcriptional regulator [Desulfoluna spongiiphila]|uniref:sigma 54-interacting transcriptional regulator n=1 Tax=Desulfoluna spongiiphila TaxID=419481 RepID=UPI0012554637|nr:sigma 54-interacting transcriptional regulator [Desulfoluna spongiiphila]VVS92669.1 activator of aromatic catabolism [Desulfoluna spongiiphila]